jgi:hypothetical protein
MGFKSKTIPYLEVVSADGRPCMGFRRKGIGVASPVSSETAKTTSQKGRVINIRA